MRELDWRIKAISERQNRKIEFNAAIHGIKLKGSKTKSSAPELTEEQSEKLSKVIEAKMQQGSRNGGRKNNCKG